MSNIRAKRNKPKRLLLVDDHPIVRERLAELIQREADLVVCGEAEDASQALKAVETTRPDLVIADLALKNSHGLDLIKDLHIRHPALPVLVISMHDESLYAERSIRAGARGYITKQQATRDMLRAIRTVLSGEMFVSGKVLSALTAKLACRSSPLSHGQVIDSLADRELRVFELLGQGQGTRQIATQLHLDMRTIETYRARIKEKLGLKNAYELLQQAIRWAEGERSKKSL